MNTAPAGSAERKLYHSRTSGLVAAEDAKLPSFLAARSRKRWMATRSPERSYTPTGTQASAQGPWRGGGAGVEWNQLLHTSPPICCLSVDLEGRRPNEADHEHLKRAKGRITVKLLWLLNAWLKYDGYLTEKKNHLLEQEQLSQVSQPSRTMATFVLIKGTWAGKQLGRKAASVTGY